MGKHPLEEKVKERKRKFEVKGKKKIFTSFEGDTTKTKKEAKSLAQWMEKWPHTKLTALVRKDGSRYRVWFREEKRRRRR